MKINGFLKGICAMVTGVFIFCGYSPSETFTKTNALETNSEVTALKNNVTNLNLKGYVGQNLKNNVKYWQYTAYENNKNIIEQIVNAQANSLSFSGILGTDYFGVDSYYDINVVEHDSSNAIGWTLKTFPASSADRDIRFVNDINAITDWTGISELWISIDTGEISTATQIRVAFEENVVGRESFALKENATVYLTDSTSTVSVNVLSGGFVPISSGFKGYLRIPFNSNSYYCYWSDNGNNTLDVGNVVQFQMALKGDSQMVGKTLYMDDFAIVGTVNGEALPVSVEGLPNHYTYKKVWDIEGLSVKTEYTASSLAWYGEFVGKLLTGMAFSYKATADEQLKEVALNIINELAKAQGKDGYLGVFIGKQRFSLGASNWDLWNHYHAIVGLLEWYQLTRSQQALEVAINALECIYTTFKDRSYLVMGGFETNRGIAHGYAMAYKVTGRKRYLDEAERIIMQDCQDLNSWYRCALNDREFYQSSSSRWEVLHMIMTLGILYEETGKTEYYTVMENVWQSILKYDIHNGGGFTTNENATGDAYAGGVIETCCTIAWMAFTNEYYKYAKSVVAVDELERSYYNAMLGSLLENDKYCTYNTPMDGISGSCGGYDGRRVSSQRDIAFQYNPGSPDMNCCQANLARGIGQIAEWACLTDNDQLYLNYFGTSEIETLVGGNKVKLKLTSSYPVSGKIAVQIEGLEKDAEFTLKIRIPTWAHGSSVSINGEIKRATPGQYFDLRKTWKNGDKFEINLGMDVTYLVGEKSKTSYTSVYYGPILLTLDKSVNIEYNQDIVFNVEDIENAEISSGSLRGGILDMDINVSGKAVKLIDFASAGKTAGGETTTYWSWLKVEGAPVKNSDDYTKLWHGTNKNKVYFGDNIISDKALYNVGETVIFSVNEPKGLKLDKVSVTALGEEVDVSYENGNYSFTMPNDSVEVSVDFVKNEEYQDSSVDSSKENGTDKKGCKSALGVEIPLATLSLGATAIILKKKEE